MSNFLPNILPLQKQSQTPCPESLLQNRHSFYQLSELYLVTFVLLPLPEQSLDNAGCWVPFCDDSYVSELLLELVNLVGLAEGNEIVF